MNARIWKKIARNRKHALRANLLMQHISAVETYALSECARLGLPSSGWGRYALAWPKRLSRRISILRTAR